MPDRLTIEDLLALRSVGQVEVSPDGRRVAFVVQPTSPAVDAAPSGQVWTWDRAGSARQLTGGDGADALPCWSADGSMLAFVRGLHALHVMTVDGEPQALCELDGAVESLRWAADGAAIVALVADPEPDPVAVETDPVVHGPSAAWRRLVRVDVDAGQARQVSPAGVNVWEFDWVGGEHAVAVVSDRPGESAWYDAQIALLDLDRQDARVLHRPERQVQAPVFSPDRRSVAFIAGLASDRGGLVGTIATVDVESCEATVVAPELDVCGIRWLADGRIAYAGVRGLETTCGRVDLDGTIDELWTGRATPGEARGWTMVAGRDGSVFAAALQAPDQPIELAVCEADAPAPRWELVTSFNQALAGRATSVVDRFTWQCEGREIEGLLLLPGDRGTEPLPLVVVAHGGPTFAWTFAFSYGLGHEGLLLAEDGYAVLMPNPRGSVGRGQEFTRANVGDLGGGDLRDILAGVQALAADGLVDPTRVGITGGSYGGYLSAWAPTQTDAFQAAVPIRSVTDWASFQYSSSVARFNGIFLDGERENGEGNRLERSPVAHAARCTTPTLLLHGELDPAAPVGQAHELHRALRDAGCEAELVVYRRGGHGWRQAEYVVDQWNRLNAWFDRHLSPEASRPSGS